MLKDESNIDLHQTVRRQQDEISRLRRLVASTPGVMCWKDINGVYLGCSAELASEHTASSMLYPFDRDAHVVGKTDFDLFSREIAERIRDHDKEVMQFEQELIREHELVLPSGQKAVHLVSKRPMYDENHRLSGVISIHVDAHNISRPVHQATSSSTVNQKSLVGYDEVEKIKRSFISNMEHDIRTPFSGVYGMANQLWETEEDGHKKEYLGDITRCAKELLDYCNSFLDFSKVEMGAIPIKSQKFDLRSMLDKVVAMETPAAKAKNIGFYLDIDHDIPRVLMGDNYRLERILLNLVGNAVKFTDQGQVLLRVEALDLRLRHAVIRFTVQDSGVGIPNEKINLIYEKFTRLSDSNQGFYHGLGLGLRIVKQFVAEMEGEIDATSQVGEGSCFEVTLPLQLPLIGDAALQRLA